MREEIISSSKKEIDIIKSARLGSDDYDFKTVKFMKEGGQSIVFSIKSKVDGKVYAAKKLKYQIGSDLNTRNS